MGTPEKMPMRDGHERRFDVEPNGECRVLIRHRVTSNGVTPELWSMWESWGDFDSEAKAREEHDYALENGPWGRPKTA